MGNRMLPATKFGQRFGSLVVYKPDVGRDRYGGVLVKCICDCGIWKDVNASGLNSGFHKSCGCLRKPHGLSRTKAYVAWKGAVHRTLPLSDSHKDYGGRGIWMCLRWRESVEAFVEDMGQPSNSKMQLDREDVDGHYSCGRCVECVLNGWKRNCRWVTAAENGNNRRNNLQHEFLGRVYTEKQWAVIGMRKYPTLWHRIHTRGWTFEEALCLPPGAVRRPVTDADRERVRRLIQEYEAKRQTA